MWWTKKQKNRDSPIERNNMMFKNLYCPNCGERNDSSPVIRIDKDLPGLVCYECDAEFTAEDLRERASEFARIAWALDAIAKVDGEDVGITVELEMKKETIYS